MSDQTIDAFQRLAVVADIKGINALELTDAMLDRLEATWGASRTAALIGERRGAISSGLRMALGNAAEFRDLYDSLFLESAGGDSAFVDDPVQTVVRGELLIAASEMLGDAWTDEIELALDQVAAVVFRFVLGGLTVHAASALDDAALDVDTHRRAA